MSSMDDYGERKKKPRVGLASAKRAALEREQHHLFGGPPSASGVTPGTRASDPPTSKAAAERATIGVRRSQVSVLFVFQNMLGHNATDEEMIRAYHEMEGRHDLNIQSESGLRTRRKELVTLGYLRDSGRTRAITTGGQSTVWEITARGRDYPCTELRYHGT